MTDPSTPAFVAIRSNQSGDSSGEANCFKRFAHSSLSCGRRNISHLKTFSIDYAWSFSPWNA